MERIQLECIVYRKNGDKYEYLLLKRIPKKGGFWQPPCGKMEKNDETILDGCYREIEEESSITKDDIIKVLDNVHYFEINKHYLTGEPIPTVKEHVLGFEVTMDTNVSIEHNIYPEHDEYKWVSFEEAMVLLKWQNNKDAFVKLNELLTSTIKE
jgi:8-oxo-dGTP pyrophosphatase MutT (NUDIX family)